MEPRIETIGTKKLVGKRMKMSLTNNKTHELWHSFMSERKEVKEAIGTDLFSVNVYDSFYFRNFDPNNEFEKWAAIEVQNTDNIPYGMGTLTLTGGMYAVFFYKGSATAAAPAFQYIFGSWVPNSEYELDNRPHFEVLTEKYKNDDPDSEEEIWMPVKLKR